MLGNACNAHPRPSLDNAYPNDALFSVLLELGMWRDEEGRRIGWDGRVGEVGE